VTAVDQALEHAQLADLRVAVDPFAVHIPERLGEAVAALPDPQRVLAQAGLAFDRLIESAGSAVSE